MPGRRPSRGRGSGIASALASGDLLRRALSALTIVGPATVLFLFVLQISIAGALRSRSPQVALAWSPVDAEARATIAARILTMDRASAESRRRAAALARDAIDRDLTRVAAFRALALATAEPGQPSPQAEQLMTLAQRVSRRDQATQLWLADRAARRRDAAALMRHFDIALRTTSRSRETLLAALVAASRDPMITPAVTQALAERPNWWLQFMSAAIATGTPDQVLHFARGRLNPAVPQERAMIRSVIEALSAARAYDFAWQIYGEALGVAGAGALRQTVRNGGFEAAPDFAPFEWTLNANAEREASREARPDGAGAALRLSAESDSRGDAATQLLHLPPGSYRLRLEIGQVADNREERPQIVVRCATGDRVLGAAAPQTAGPGPFALQAQFQVPPDCLWQWLAVQVSGSASDADSGAWIDNVTIMRL